MIFLALNRGTRGELGKEAGEGRQEDRGGNEEALQETLRKGSSLSCDQRKRERERILINLVFLNLSPNTIQTLILYFAIIYFFVFVFQSCINNLHDNFYFSCCNILL